MSLAFDIADRAPYGSALRTVVFAVELGRRAGAADDELRETFWASLLGRLGAANDASNELAQMAGLKQDTLFGDGLSLASRLVQFGRMTVTTRAEHGRHGAKAVVTPAGDRLDARLRRVLVDRGSTDLRSLPCARAQARRGGG
jgi:hypothetical protein